VSFTIKPRPAGPYPLLLDAGPSSHGWHKTATWLRCPQLWAYQNLLGIDFPASDPLVKGSLVHIGTAHVHARRVCVDMGWPLDTYETPARAIERVAEAEQAKRGGSWLAWVDLTKAAVAAYERNTAIENLTWRVVGVEVEFKAEIEGFPYTQRIDLVLQHRTTGQIMVDDTKTTSARLGSAATDRAYGLSGQFMGMRWFGSQRFGDKFGGVRIRYVQLPTGEVALRDLPAAPWAYQRFPSVVAEARRAMERSKTEGRDPWGYEMKLSELVCEHRYGPCEASQLCMNGPSAVANLGMPTAGELRTGRS
jgi:hypothetical protein